MYICQICKKKPATIHLTDIHNNVKKEVHICETCASEKGFNLQGASNLPQLLGLAAKKIIPSQQHQQTTVVKGKAPENDVACSYCGITWSQFSERGRLGCPHDYEDLDVRLRPLIAGQIAPHMQNSNVFHVGKTPGACHEPDTTGKAIRALEKRLRQAVAEENYEAAAGFKAELDKLRREQDAQANIG